jgi:hypothetical protein
MLTADLEIVTPLSFQLPVSENGALAFPTLTGAWENPGSQAEIQAFFSEVGGESR